MSSSYQLRGGLLGICSILLTVSVICVQAEQDVSLEDTLVESSDQGNRVQFWPWDKHKFQCPSSFGTFSDPDDCSFFYVCVANIATRRQCRRLQQFDKNLRVCVSFLIAVCDDSGKSKTTTQAPKVTGTTPKGDDKFTCPGMIGSFLHPTDCTKYYTCTFFIPSLKTCPSNELFDGVKKECKPAKDVHCGTRWRPTEDTTHIETTQEITTQPPTTTAEPSTTTTREPSSPTTSPPDELTTTRKPRVTAPDTDCDPDDLDCIIDDLGENPVWFVCETDVGSYPHPTSNKLFIFCLNWKPSVKKCGQDLVFSEDLMTCVSP